ncbi:MAG TPA: response regulator [Candidatus Binatia bacterium]|jgi:CheY-like chemotaxis protein|nr:response regulator [Candidatus Binatia bacterium]
MPGDDLFLLVEDSEEDVFLLRRVFLKANIINPLQVVKGGREALAYLSGSGPYANRAEHPFPALVLLDLNMPDMNGFEVLEWIRRQPAFMSLRVVVLTVSGHAADINRAYKLGANSFLTKPTDFDRFVEISQALSGYWLWTSAAPDASRPVLSLPQTAAAPADQPIERVNPVAVALLPPRIRPPGP